MHCLSACSNNGNQQQQLFVKTDIELFVLCS